MSGQDAVPYQVLARKYRPQTFDELIGQEALVRTLGNAIARNRLHHGYMLTGVRGVGKTTTARIIAKALNCRNADGPTMEPCGTCEDCRAIVDGRHIDVQELDAASRTKVEQMRELLDGVPYLPVQARTKVYIIDEVHMLSTNSFNALLKTLEEPPEHVVFIFATTEIRKVPVTVLSRCQRFDLRRVPADKLIAHLGSRRGRRSTRGRCSCWRVPPTAPCAIRSPSWTRPLPTGRARPTPRWCATCWGWPTGCGCWTCMTR